MYLYLTKWMACYRQNDEIKHLRASILNCGNKVMSDDTSFEDSKVYPTIGSGTAHEVTLRVAASPECKRNQYAPIASDSKLCPYCTEIAYGLMVLHINYFL
jgi:hypothetical protein